MSDPLAGASLYIAKKYLPELYKRLRTIAAKRDAELQRIGDVGFGDPLELAKYYIEPNCQPDNPADEDEEQALLTMRSPVFDTMNGFLDRTITPGTGRNQMFILSDAGMGKSSLLVMLKLSHLTRFWPDKTKCELLKLGKDTLETIGALEGRAQTVLLLDALDEDPCAWGRAEPRLTEVLSETSDFRRVVISCRTQFLPKGAAVMASDPTSVVGRGFRCPRFFLSLFRQEQVNEYLRRRYPTRWYSALFRRAADRQQEAAELLRLMQSLRFRPLLLANIDDLVGRPVPNGESEWSEFLVYQTLVRVWLEREVSKASKMKLEPAPSYDELFRASVELAVRMHGAGVRSCSAQQMRGWLPVAFQWVDKFEFGGRSLLNKDSAGHYRFSHYSIQEYLVAEALLAGSAPKGTRATTKLLSFVLGRLGTRPVLQRLDFADVDLSSAGLGKSLSGADLSALDLRGVNLRGADLSRAKLHETVLASADLSDADLSDADLSDADLSDANLRGANLSGATLRGAILKGCIDCSKRGGVELMLIPGGTFTMGSPSSEEARFDNEGPQHEVTVSPFYLGRYPVTNEEYGRFLEANPSAAAPEYWSDRQFNQARQPVIGVSWEQAQRFCQWAGGRLPTEAEWEYACRAGTTGSRYGQLDEVAWYSDNSGRQPHPVGEKLPNEWGLHDMLGNVWEWCADRFGDYSSEAQTDPRGPETGVERVLRGGGWNDDGRSARSAYRLWLHPAGRLVNLGFRLSRGQEPARTEGGGATQV